jgi:hypothetical protein
MKCFNSVGIVFIVCVAGFALSVTPVNAAYVLPYPSYMPGHVLYGSQKVFDRMQEWWYFGLIGQAMYYRTLSDRYMVESKTLFEYGQHKLATQALVVSNKHFLQAYLTIMDLEAEEYDAGQQRILVQEASIKHKEILTYIDTLIPDEIVWEEEKKDSETLPIALLLRQAHIIRSYAE